MRSLEFTDAAFVRSHMAIPKGRGSWAFQESQGTRAFDRELVGEVVWAPGSLTLTEAKRWMADTGHTGLWAILP